MARSAHEGVDGESSSRAAGTPDPAVPASVLFEALADAALVFTPAGIIRSANRAAERVFGRAAAEFTGRSMATLLSNGDAASFLYQLQNDLHAHRDDFIGRPHEMRGRRKSGAVFPLELTVTTLAGRDGEYLLCIARDITERRLAHDRLVTQAARLHRANQDLEQFAYIASHDLQEPLRMVSCFTELFARRYQLQVDEAGREFLGYALDGAKRMKLLIADLLDYSRLSSDTGAWQKVDMNVVFGDAVRTLALAIRDSDATIDPGRLPSLFANRNQLRQVFYHLVGNAIKYQAPDRPPRIVLDAAREGELWHFTVKDNGIGIPEEYLSRIFMIFHRLHRERRYPGTGVGLAICKRIVELHGGTIWAESVRGEGSEFHFTLADRPPHDPALAG